MNLLKIMAVIGIIHWGFFETLHLSNSLDALSVGKDFLKAHHATVESIDCRVPGRAVFDRSIKVCTFQATPNQIHVLVQNLGFRSINLLRFSEAEIDQLYAQIEHKAKTTGVVEPKIRMKMHDARRSFHIEDHVCWSALDLKHRSELELYGTSEVKASQFEPDFFIFYDKMSAQGCWRFEWASEG